jgi:multicomponent K+:H+ antiporter subunit E
VKGAAAPPTRRVQPVLVGVLLATWLLLNQSVAAGHIVLGLGLGVALAWATSVMRPAQPRLRHVHLIGLLILRVVRDVVRSNVDVARIVLGLVRGRDVRAGFVSIPLQMQDPHGLAVLACIVTSTPGTVWVDHDPATRILTLHVLDLKDDGAWTAWIKTHYETLLLRIFE